MDYGKPTPVRAMTHTTPCGTTGFIDPRHVLAMNAQAYEAHMATMNRAYARALGLEAEPARCGGAGPAEGKRERE